MVVTPRTAHIPKNRKYSIHTGICSDVRFGAHSNTLQNVQRAVAERVLFVPDGSGGLKNCPKPQSKSYLTKTMLPFHNLLRKMIRNDLSFPIPPASSDDFVNTYSGAKKKRYQEACDSLLIASAVQKDARLKSFVKIEKINFSSKLDPAPRIIQPRTFRYSAALGMIIKHLEKPLFKKIDQIFGGPTVLKGYDCIKSGKIMKDMWDEFENPVAIGLDASRFDQHCSTEMLEWEHSVWEMFTTSKREIKQLLKWQLTNKGTAYVDDGKLKYQVNGSRMSGDMNTSSGNCLIMCAMIYNYCHSQNVQKFRLANNGDDCILIVESKNFSRINQPLTNWFNDLGYTMKVEPPVYVFEQISFCQTQPIFDGVGYRMVRDPRVAMAKDLCCLLNLDQERVKNLWYNAMHHGGKSLTIGIPCWQKFYDMFPTTNQQQNKNETTLNGFQNSGFTRMTPKIEQVERDVTSQSRFSFWLGFGILPDTQVMLENRFKSIHLEQCERIDSQDYSELSVLVEN